MATGVLERDIRAGLLGGGYIRNVLVVRRVVPLPIEHIAYLRVSWHRGFLPMRTWLGESDRTYRDLNRLITLIVDDFGYSGPIVLYSAGDPNLARYRAMAAGDRNIDPLEKADE